MPSTSLFLKLELESLFSHVSCKKWWLKIYSRKVCIKKNYLLFSSSSTTFTLSCFPIAIRVQTSWSSCSSIILFCISHWMSEAKCETVCVYVCVCWQILKGRRNYHGVVLLVFWDTDQVVEYEHPPEEMRFKRLLPVLVEMNM